MLYKRVFGDYRKSYYDKRYRYLSDFNDFLLLLIDGISYAKDRLPEITKKYIASSKGEIL